jgi:hypothetical protein
MTLDEIKVQLEKVKSGELHPLDATILLGGILEWVIFEGSADEPVPDEIPLEKYESPERIQESAETN